MSFSYGCPYLSDGVGIYILAEVALGYTQQGGDSHCNEKNLLSKGFNSTTNGSGLKSANFEKVFGDVSVPFLSKANSTSNMFIVYNPNQVRIRYIVRIKEKKN